VANLTPQTLTSAPRQFDTAAAVLLPIANGWPGILDELNYYAADDHATVWGVAVTKGRTLFDAYLTSEDGGSTNWVCPVQAFDKQNVYTAVSLSADAGPQLSVELTAVSKSSGNVEWRYSPPTIGDAVASECDMDVAYSLTSTAAGVLFTLAQPESSLSAMLDPDSGDVVWQSDAPIQVTDGARIGIIADGGNFSVVDLFTGQVGAAVIQTPAPSNGPDFSYSLAGQTGSQLVIVGVTGASPMIVYQIDATSGQLVTPTPVTLARADLTSCQVDGSTLVCTGSSQDTAYGLSLVDGSAIWQRVFSDAGTLPPLIFDGSLYGVSGGVSYVLDVATGNVVSQGAWPQPIALNEVGMVYGVSDQTTGVMQYWWAPAV